MENKIMEDKLRKVNRELAQIVQGSPIATFVINKEHIITRWNKACENLTGISANKMIGTKKQWSIFYSEERPVMADLVVDNATEEEIKKYYADKCRKSAVIEGAYEAEGFLGEGILWYFFTAAPLRDIEGNVIAAIETLQDITERKIREAVEEVAAEALRKTAEQLKESTARLIQAEKLEAVGQLASGVAHEVKNPLAIIIQGVNYLTRHVAAEKGILRTLEMIKSNVKRADSIVSALVDFSRASKLGLQLQDINPILESSLRLMEHKLRLENIKIIKEMGENLPQVLVDKGKMEQVFINILLNSIQAMPNGGELSIRSYLIRLKAPGEGIGTRSEYYSKFGQRAMMIEIEDTGVGISQENVKRVFDPFFTMKGPRDGTGLGLSVTKNIIDLHGGIIEINSEKGKGTKVIVVLKIHGGE